jgi:hypothetical protein
MDAAVAAGTGRNQAGDGDGDEIVPIGSNWAA